MIENIFYRLWSKSFYYTITELYQKIVLEGNRTDDYLVFVKVKDNDAVFLKELNYKIYIEKQKIKAGTLTQIDSVDYFLRGLFSYYVKRFDDGQMKKHQIDWLNHTRELTKQEYPEVYKWCNEYQEEFIK